PWGEPGGAERDRSLRGAVPGKLGVDRGRQSRAVARQLDRGLHDRANVREVGIIYKRRVAGLAGTRGLIQIERVRQAGAGHLLHDLPVYRVRGADVGPCAGRANAAVAEVGPGVGRDNEVVVDVGPLAPARGVDGYGLCVAPDVAGQVGDANADWVAAQPG